MAEANNSFPKVSVIIPVYNVEPYLRECLDSVVNQTLRDIEIICVNDGSTDGSPAILKEYQEKDPRVIVFRQENRGLSAARNHSMRHARGMFVCFLDSDDFLDPETLEKTVPLVEENDLDVLIFERETFYESEELKHVYPQPIKKIEKRSPICSGVRFLKEAKDSGIYSSTAWGKIWRRSFLMNNTLCFKEGIIHEDNLFCFLAFMSAKKVLSIPDAFYHRRIRPNSIVTRPKSHENVIGLFSCAEGMLAYALCGNYSAEEDREIKRAYVSMILSAKRLYLEIPPEERAKVSFHNETLSELFQETVLNRIQIDQLRKEVSKLREEKSPLKDFNNNDIEVVQVSNMLTLTNHFRSVPVQYAWYVYKGNEPILKQGYTVENSNRFSYEFTETGSYKIRAFIRTMDKADIRSIDAVRVTVDRAGLSWK